MRDRACPAPGRARGRRVPRGRCARRAAAVGDRGHRRPYRRPAGRLGASSRGLPPPRRGRAPGGAADRAGGGPGPRPSATLRRPARQPLALIVVAAGLAASGCGSSSSGSLPPELARTLAARSDEVARALERGDPCAAERLALAPELRRRTARLAAAITCVAPPPVAPVAEPPPPPPSDTQKGTKEKPKKHEKHKKEKGHAKGHKG